MLAEVEKERPEVAKFLLYIIVTMKMSQDLLQIILTWIQKKKGQPVIYQTINSSG